MAPARKLMPWVFLFVSCLAITSLAEDKPATNTPQTNQADDASKQEQQTNASNNTNKPDQQQQTTQDPNNVNKPDQQQQTTQDPNNTNKPNQGATNTPGNLNQGTGGPSNNQQTSAPNNSTNTPANSTKPHILNDTTDFVKGLNGWDLSGLWGKVDLLTLSNVTRPLPLVPDAADQEVFICHPWIVPSHLEKTFPALSNGTLSLVYHVAAPNNDINMTGEVFETREGGTGVTVYNYTFPEDLMEHNDKWVRQEFKLPNNITTKGEFKVRLSIQWGKTGLWAAGSVGVVGDIIPPTPPPPTPTVIIIPPTNTTGEIPLTTPTSVNASQALNATTEMPTNGTQLPVNGTQAPVNSTDAPVNATESNNGTVVVPGGAGANGTDQPTTTLDPHQHNHAEEVGQLAGVAQAIWDAFYVFLALFCACLVALVALIVHGRCKNDEPPPTVATYNPRTSSYRLDKVYDNPSYDNHAV